MITSREVALNVLQAIETGKHKSDHILHRTLKETALNHVDRALTTAIVNGVIRYRLQLDFLINRYYHHKLEKVSSILKNILRLGTYQIVLLDKVPDWAAVNECVKLARKYKGECMSKLVNGVLRKIATQNITLDDWLKNERPEKQLAVKYSHPQWIVERWIKIYGLTKTEDILTYNNQFPVFGFRINQLKNSYNQFFADPVFAATPHKESGIENFFLAKDFSIFEPAVKDGRLTVQNPTQSFACLLLNPSPNSSVLDLCAAPGGKSTFMAELMQDIGTITAIDRYDQKLLKTNIHAKALGITIISTITADARNFVTKNAPDLILLDAPCSGTGVLGRRAELRWKLTPETLHELIDLQKELLDHTAKLLDENGTLVYATCSIEPEENTLQIKAFLQRHPDFIIDYDSGQVPKQFWGSKKFEGAILTLPGNFPGFDGGFCQRLRKIGKKGNEHTA
ncbi:MAG: 16S rRNA (cytosine(967)-C(5))-methyltransferase RsmB [Chlorobiaceae bacterium]